MTREVLTKRQAINEFQLLKRGFSRLDLLKIPLYFRMLRHEKLVRHEGRIVISTFLPPFPSRAFENVFNRGTDYPAATNIAVTNQCHNRCGYCSYGASKQSDHYVDGIERENRPKKKELELSQLTDIISQVQDLNVPIIGFTGGEPLLRKDLEEVVANVDERSATILYTSGIGLTIERAKSLKQAGLSFLSVSLDHLNRDINDKLRFPGSYESAISAIQNSLEAGLYTVSTVVVTEETINGLESYIDFANELGVHGIRILDIVPSGECIKKLPLGMESRKRVINIHKKVNANPLFPQLTTFSYFEGADMFGCGAGGIHHMYIDGNGYLRACDFIPIRFGDLTKEPLSVAYARMRELFRFPEDECFMKRYHQVIDMALGEEPNRRKVIHYDEIVSQIREVRTGSLPKLYKGLK